MNNPPLTVEVPDIQELPVSVTAMARIVRDLVTGGPHDGAWLRAQATAAGLGAHETEALEALRLRLLAQGVAQPYAGPIGLWN